MEVPPAGMEALNPDRAVANAGGAQPAKLSAVDAAAPMASDSVAALLAELSQSDLSRLLQIVKATPQAGDQNRVEELLQAAVETAANRNVGGALDFLRQVAALDPARAESFASVPALASMRAALEQWLNRLTAGARLQAEGRLAEATQKLETASFKDAADIQVKPEILLHVAACLIQAGGLANYVQSASVSEALLEQCRWAPAEHSAMPPANRGEPGWHAPAWLMAVWFASGFAGAALCWWLRDDWLPIVCGAWAGGLVVLMAIFAWRRPRRSYPKAE
jgi:hypothetical protein